MPQLVNGLRTRKMDTSEQATDSFLNISFSSDVNMTTNRSIFIAEDYAVSEMGTVPTDYAYYSWNTTNVEVPLLKQTPQMVAIYCLAYGLVFIIALFGNGLVLALVIREPSMRNVTNYFIVSLAAADFFVALINVPMTLLNSIFTGRYKLKYIYLSRSPPSPIFESPSQSIHPIHPSFYTSVRPSLFIFLFIFLS